TATGDSDQHEALLIAMGTYDVDLAISDNQPSYVASRYIAWFDLMTALAHAGYSLLFAMLVAGTIVISQSIHAFVTLHDLRLERLLWLLGYLFFAGLLGLAFA